MALLYEGQLIRETYEVERFLGEGAFAEVYRVRHRFLGRQAMKVLKTPRLTIAETQELLDEAVILSRFGHPNIIRVFDANIVDDNQHPYAFFTMEYVAGGSLEQFWRSHGAQFVPIETAVEITRQVCRGLTLAHAEKPPIIHRDIKLQNILVGYDETGLRVRVSDFGLAKRANPLTLLASARGTRAFKPPEVFRDVQSDSCLADVWAIGTTLYLLLTDRLPFSPLNETNALDVARFERPIIPPSRLNLQVDAALDQIVLRALMIPSERRYPTAKEMLTDLEGWYPHSPKESRANIGTSTDMAKSALGLHSPVDDASALDMVQQALKMAQQAEKLTEAGDLLEEAINKRPSLRNRYEYRLKLWRRGISG